MPAKLIIFTGAPESSTLDWAPDGLLSSFDPSIAEFTGITNQTTSSAPAPEPTAPNHAEWRSLPLHTTRLHTGFSQQYSSYPSQHTANPNTEFYTSFSTSGAPLAPDSQDSQFYETSVAAHHRDVPTSQLVAAEESQFTNTTSSFNTTATASFTSTAPPPKDPLPPGAPPLALSDLSSLPSARHLAAISPQTMTCNLVVGLISLSPPRAVQTRYGTSHLVEALVGDDTRAGFAITFWLSPNSTNTAPGDITSGALLATLRPRDVVLLQNVALNTYNKGVYGSSLRRGMTRAYLLYRVGEGGEGGYYGPGDLRRAVPGHAQVEKTRRVRDWVVGFVGGGGVGGEEGQGRGARKRKWDVMPDVDETQ